MDELHQVGPPRGAKSRRQVGDVLTGQIGRHPCQQPIPQPPAERGLRRVRSSGDDEVVFAKPFDQTWRQRGTVLPVGVDYDDELTGGRAETGLHRSAVPLVVGVSEDGGAGATGLVTGVVFRSIVHDENLGPRCRFGQRAHDRGDACRFVVSRDDNRCRARGSHYLAISTGSSFGRGLSASGWLAKPRNSIERTR